MQKPNHEPYMNWLGFGVRIQSEKKLPKYICQIRRTIVAKRQLKGLVTIFALKPVPPLALPLQILHISQLHQPPIHCVENILEFLSVYEKSIFRRHRGYYN